MVEYCHLAHSHFISHLLIRFLLKIAQTENELSDRRFQVFDEKQQLLQSLIGFIRQNNIGIIYEQLRYLFLHALMRALKN